MRAAAGLPLTALVPQGRKARPGESWPCAPHPSAAVAVSTQKLKDILFLLAEKQLRGS